jgi:hypothetical protein
MSAPRPIPRDELAMLLASALGLEKSIEVVLTAARSIGLSGNAYSHEEARAIFEALSQVEGLVGVVARFAVSRGDLEIVLSRAPPSVRAMRTLPAPEEIDLVSLLAPALGTEKARDATLAAAAKLGLDASSLSRDGALAVLEDLAQKEGIVGVVARFAKTRFLLQDE